MSQLNRLAAQLGYNIQNDVAYGRTGGIYFNITYAPDSSSALVRAYIRPLESLTFRNTGRGAGIDLVRIGEYLKVRRREFPNDGAQADERSVQTVLSGDAVKKTAQISRFVYEFSRFLSELGYVSSCAECPETRRLTHSFQDNQVLELCGACMRRLGAQIVVAREEASSSWLRGTAGAALGGLIAAIPWILLQSFSWLAASICGLLMAWLVFTGYQKAGGRRGRAEILSIAAVLIILTYISVTAGYAVDEYRYLLRQGADVGLFPLIGAKLTAVFHAHDGDTGVLWIRLGVGWLFSGLGGVALMLRKRHESAMQTFNAARVGQKRHI